MPDSNSAKERETEPLCWLLLQRGEGTGAGEREQCSRASRVQGSSDREDLWLGLISSKGCQPLNAADGLYPLRVVAVKQWHFGSQRAVHWRQQQPSGGSGTSCLEEPKCVYLNHFGQHRSVGFTQKIKT